MSRIENSAYRAKSRICRSGPAMGMAIHDERPQAYQALQENGGHTAAGCDVEAGPPGREQVGYLRELAGVDSLLDVGGRGKVQDVLPDRPHSRRCVGARMVVPKQGPLPVDDDGGVVAQQSLELGVLRLGQGMRVTNKALRH